MAAPASILQLGYTFRDAKGQTARMRMLIGGTNAAAVITNYNNGGPLLQACTNAFVHQTSAPDRNYTYGNTADYQTVEDKAVFTFRDEWGSLHKFQLPAPIAGIFENDQETVNQTDSAVEAMVTWFQSFVYAHSTATAPLALVGALRQRRKMQRKFNIFTLDPTLGEEGE